MCNVKERPSAQPGFTLVELVVVIVILGILAATALPRFITVRKDAHIAELNSLAGGLRSAVAVSRARYFANSIAASSITMADGSEVKVGTLTTAQGVPTGMHEGIGAAMRCESPTACNGFTVAHMGIASISFFWPPTTTSQECYAGYDGGRGVVTVTTSGC